MGSAWMPCERPMAGVARCSSARRRQAASRRIAPREDLVGGGDELQRERRVEHVGRRHAEMQPARGLTGELLDVREERDDVVARALLVLEDARRIQLAGGLRLDGDRRARGGRSRPPPWPGRRPARHAATCRSGIDRTKGG